MITNPVSAALTVSIVFTVGLLFFYAWDSL